MSNDLYQWRIPNLTNNAINPFAESACDGCWPPFSFIYDGKPSRDILCSWERSDETLRFDRGVTKTLTAFFDKHTSLRVTCESTYYEEFRATEWVLFFKNTGVADTPIIEEVRPLYLSFSVPDGEVILHRSHGSTSADTDFLPVDETLEPKARIDLAPVGGRSSNGVLPFFNLEWNGGGVVGAIGWSGQWAMSLQREDKNIIKLQAGQQTTRLLLHPGEQIRTPRILLVPWEGPDRLRGHNLLRRLLLDHYAPRPNGEIALPPITALAWFFLNNGNDVTETNQKVLMPLMVRSGAEGYWLDAGWFEGGWPYGAGSWVPKKEAFPQGLKPVGDQAHRLGMKFVLWFEPERVTGNSRVAKEHPEWVLHHKEEINWGALYNLGNSEARVWLTDYLSQCITEWGVDIYRNDFNLDPLPFWEAADTSDRKGMSEIRYIEGLYAMWDELLKRHPSLTIDNCASGGRRIDLEMTRRSYPLWQSDTQCCGGPMPVQDQIQNAGLSLYVPLHAMGVWAFDPYNFRSAATIGCCLCADIYKDEKMLEVARGMTDEAKSLRPYYLGDYYPLLEITLNKSAWCGWQYDRPDLDKGFVMLFRRDQSPYSKVTVALRGLDAEAIYHVINREDNTKQMLTGAEMSGQFEVEIRTKPGCVLFMYAKIPT